MLYLKNRPHNARNLVSEAIRLDVTSFLSSTATLPSERLARELGEHWQEGIERRNCCGLRWLSKYATEPSRTFRLWPFRLTRNSARKCASLVWRSVLSHVAPTSRIQ